MVAKTSNFQDILKLSILFDDSELNKEEKIKRALANDLVWVAKDGEQIVGYCLVELFDDKHEQLPNSIFIADLYVLDEYRKQGVGKMLIEKVLNNKFSKKYSCFSLSHDPEEEHLTDFYKTFGFEVIGKTKAGNIKMVKKR